MARNISENTERNISRHLDGCLSPDEQTELYRELLRNPDARAVMDEFQANDQLAAHALTAMIELRGTSGSAEESRPLVLHHRGVRPITWLATAAACVALMVTSGWMALHIFGSRPAGNTVIAQNGTNNPGTPIVPTHREDTNRLLNPGGNSATADGSGSHWVRLPAPESAAPTEEDPDWRPVFISDESETAQPVKIEWTKLEF